MLGTLQNMLETLQNMLKTLQNCKDSNSMEDYINIINDHDTLSKLRNVLFWCSKNKLIEETIELFKLLMIDNHFSDNISEIIINSMECFNIEMLYFMLGNTNNVNIIKHWIQDDCIEITETCFQLLILNKNNISNDDFNEIMKIFYEDGKYKLTEKNVCDAINVGFTFYNMEKLEIIMTDEIKNCLNMKKKKQSYIDNIEIKKKILQLLCEKAQLNEIKKLTEENRFEFDIECLKQACKYRSFQYIEYIIDRNKIDIDEECFKLLLSDDFEKEKVIKKMIKQFSAKKNNLYDYVIL